MKQGSELPKRIQRMDRHSLLLISSSKMLPRNVTSPLIQILLRIILRMISSIWSMTIRWRQGHPPRPQNAKTARRLRIPTARQISPVMSLRKRSPLKALKEVAREKVHQGLLRHKWMAAWTSTLSLAMESHRYHSHNLSRSSTTQKERRPTPTSNSQRVVGNAAHAQTITLKEESNATDARKTRMTLTK